MIKLNDQGQIVKVETEEYRVSREVLIAKRDELNELLAVVEKDLADYDALTAPAEPTPPAPESVA